MIDYREMYMDLLCASERVLNILIDAQRKVEEQYINAHETEIYFLNQVQEERNE